LPLSESIVFEEPPMPTLARDVMIQDVISVPKDMDLRDLSKLFLEKGISGAPVVDEAGSLVGVISQTDLLFYHLSRDDELVLDTDFYATARVDGRKLRTGFQIEDVNTGRVEDAMTPIVHSVTETTPLESVARTMLRKHIHRVIVRKGKKVAGILTALDVLRGIAPKRKPKAARGGRSRKR
jgi:CBS domain-containing protein